MKEIIIFTSALLLLAGCAREDLNPSENDYTNEGCIALSFSAPVPGFGTKAVIGESIVGDGGAKASAINWQSGDKITVFDGAVQNCVFATKGLASESSDCIFEGNVTALAKNYTAVYPYTSAASMADGNIIGINLPSNQKAVPGSFDPGAALMAARTVDGGRELSFKNLVGYLKLATDFESKMIKLCSGSGEPLAGSGKISFNAEGTPAFVLSGGAASSITLAAEGDGAIPAGTYYMAVPAGTLAAGWTINITDADGKLHICESAKAITFKNSVVVNLGTLSMSGMDAINNLVYDIPANQMEYRDPFIYVDKEGQAYYYPVVVSGGIKMFKSRDLNMWRDLGRVYNSNGLYSGYVLWAADMYKWKDNMYCIATAVPTTYDDIFTAPKYNTVFKSTSPEGSLSPLNMDHVNLIPQTDTRNIDGALYVDENGSPWIVYCREAASEITDKGYDAGVYAYRLNDDLKSVSGEPVRLFNASSSKYACPVDVRDGKNVYIADAPILWRDPASGNLICIWSHYAKKSDAETQKWYSIGQAISRSGKIEGPWEHVGIINNFDGGHGCLFEDLNGNLKLAYHLNPALSANGKPHLVIRDIAIKNGVLVNSASDFEIRKMDQTQFKVLFCNSSRAYERSNQGAGGLYLGETYNARYLIDGIEDKGWYSNFQYW
ncbi:MAG: family 43 glycosylhydrolase, partial [Candidatus Cryptobacteroides sp.]